MEWVWAAFGVIWTLGALFFAKSGLRTLKRWADAGEIDNGLRFVLRREVNPTAFALACHVNRFMSLLGFVFVIFGIVVTVGWIVRAL